MHRKITNYLSLVKFSHTIFAMPFSLIGFFLAIHTYDIVLSWRLLILVVLCMIFARNAAMAFNRFIDREIDTKNPRTAIREIPRGLIKPRSALHFVILNSILFIATTYFINMLTFYLSHVALLIILGYSFTKKFTYLCHFILGLGLSLAPIGSYLAVTSRFDVLPVIFSVIVFFWVSGFDIIYALQDEEFDREEKLKSIPVWIGVKNALAVSGIVHILAALLILGVNFFPVFGKFYLIGSMLFVLLLIFQHFLVKHDDLSKVNVAFFTTNGIASVIFATFTLLDFYY